MFKCKVCEEKDKRVQEMDRLYSKTLEAQKAEIENLRTLLVPPSRDYYRDTNLEANALLNGVSEQIEVPMDPEVLAERDALLSGTY